MSAHSDQFARRIVAGYLAVQAISTLSWWWCLLWLPSSRKWFQPESWPDQVLLSFWLADLSLIVIGSGVACWAVMTQTRWAALSVWVLSGAAGYATLYCIGCSAITGQAWIAAALMSCMSGLTLAMATIHGLPQQTPATFRTTPMTSRQALAWSLAQLVVFWSVFLWILPMGILELQRKAILIEPFQHTWQWQLSLVVLALASMLGLWSCITLAVCGEGTPLPTANAPKLVIAGPYRFARNPMAIAGITQGAAVGWMMGSWLIIGYAISGGIVWHIFVRPTEEAEMMQRFGGSYKDYQQAVRLWIPVPKEPFR